MLSNTGFLTGFTLLFSSLVFSLVFPHSSSSVRKQPTFLGNLLLPTRSTTKIWVVTRHQYRISADVFQTSFRGEASGGVAKCRLFSQATTKKCYGTFAKYALKTPKHHLLLAAQEEKVSDDKASRYLSEGPCLWMHPSWVGFTQHQSHVLATSGRS